MRVPSFVQALWALQRRRRHGAAWRLLILAMGLAACPIAAQALEISTGAKPVVLFDQRQDACPKSDAPDAPPRAFRDASGQVVLFAPSAINRAFVGPTLASVRRDCQSRFAASGSADPSLLDDQAWLESFYTADGRNVFGLASDGFIPARHNIPCGAGADRTDCWYNGLVAVRSTDGGRTFAYDGAPPRHIFLGPPKPYSPNVLHPAGYITVTNIVGWKGQLYLLARWRGEPPDRSGMCLLRAAPSNIGQWEALVGDNRYAVAAVKRGAGWEDRRVKCQVIAGLDTGVRGLVLYEPTQTFIAVFEGRRPNAGGDGFFYQTSQNLIDWTPPKLLMAATLPASKRGQADSYVAYPSIIDPASSDRNFGTVGNNPTLIYTQIGWDPTQQRKRYRQLIMAPIKIRP